MAFGTADRLKSDVAEGVVDVLGALSVRRGGRVGLMTFGGPSTRLLPPRGGRGARVGLRRSLAEGVAPDGTEGEPLSRALVRVGRLASMRSLIVVISDFTGPTDWARPIAALAARHTVMAVEVRDPREQELPAVGRLAMVDPETGARIEVDTADRRLRERFERAAREDRAAVAAALRRAGVEHVTLSTDGRLGAPARPEARVSFASPIYLAALAPGAARARRLRAVAAARAASTRCASPRSATLAPLLPKASAWRRRLPLALFLASLAVLALALARPHATVAVPKEQASIILVTDVSRSMLAEDVDPSRLEAARSAAQRFLQEVPDEALIGAVAFSTDPHTVEEPTDDHAEIEALIDGLSADGGTAAGDALAMALRMVDGPAEDRPPAAIVLLSDGETTTGMDPIPVAREARRLGVPIHTVALGTRDGTIRTPDGTLLPVPPDPETMREDRRAVGRPRLPGRRRRRAGRPLRGPRLARRDRDRGARDHGGLRGRRTRAAAAGGRAGRAGDGAAAVVAPIRAESVRARCEHTFVSKYAPRGAPTGTSSLAWPRTG